MTEDDVKVLRNGARLRGEPVRVPGKARYTLSVVLEPPPTEPTDDELLGEAS